MKVGSKTHYCDGTRRLSGGEVFGRLLNLYVRRSKRWVKVGTVCSNCGMHWINGHAYTVPRSAAATNGKGAEGRVTQ